MKPSRIVPVPCVFGGPGRPTVNPCGGAGIGLHSAGSGLPLSVSRGKEVKSVGFLSKALVVIVVLWGGAVWFTGDTGGTRWHGWSGRPAGSSVSVSRETPGLTGD